VKECKEISLVCQGKDLTAIGDSLHLGSLDIFVDPVPKGEGKIFIVFSPQNKRGLFIYFGLILVKFRGI